MGRVLWALDIADQDAIGRVKRTPHPTTDRINGAALLMEGRLLDMGTCEREFIVCVDEGAKAVSLESHTGDRRYIFG